jgi:hypothetical protein
MADIIEDVIIPALKADTEVKSIVSDRVYWIKPPGESYAYPFLTVIEGGDTDSESADDEFNSSMVGVAEIFSKVNFRVLQHAVKRVINSLGYSTEAGPDEWIPELKCYHKAINFKN